MKPRPVPKPGERGIALVMALVSLLVIAVIAVALMMSLSVERKLSGMDLRRSQALNIAEAGVGEALARIRNSDIILSTANPRSVAQIFLAPAGSVPVLGVDSVGLETKQPAGAWLPYSTANKSRDALTVEFKTNPARNVIYRYNPMLADPVNTTSGLPIFHITSTGTKGNSRVRVQTDVIQKPFNTLVHAAFAVGQPIKFSGDSYVCGMNHRADTPTGTDDTTPCSVYEVPGPLPATWSDSTITLVGASTQNGAAPVQSQSNTGMFYDGCWEMFGMGQAEFYAWIGNPVTAEPNPPRGLFYLDNNTITQDATGNFAFHGGDGEGFMYIDGDASINGNFNFRGVIYIEGDIQINGTCWIMGALVVRGKTMIHLANGTLTVLYSGETIANQLAKYGGQFVTLSWREVPLN